jgi:dTDP-4-dehydrorhamnose reductase
VEVNYKKCLLTGGSGLLGKNLIPFFDKGSVIYPTSTQMDVTSEHSVSNFFINNSDIDLVVHSAAFTDVKKAETDFIECNRVNVVGTFNLLKQSVLKNIKLVYISTDAVFDGKKGLYRSDEPVNPISNYAKSKTAGELLITTYGNSLVIRTSFFDRFFPYKKALTDQWTSKDYIDIMAPKIYSTIISNKTGIIHVHSKRRTIYELALLRNTNVIPCYSKELKLNYKLPIDLSLKGE